ncbi:MAG TPA: phospholipase, partial [Chitinophagaceae bacterium]|nr:phospholipase [Chitinophagaceae bacterium]
MLTKLPYRWRPFVLGFLYSMPVQLLLLHVRKYQILLIFWYILAATVSGGFMSSYGASSLFLAPEYLGEVNGIGTAIVGFCVGIFIMSWNITTFILHSKDIRFLATTAQPFLKYCINNAVLPILFLLLYLVKALQYI